jgi:hypothetical protein
MGVNGGDLIEESLFSPLEIPSVLSGIIAFFMSFLPFQVA